MKQGQRIVREMSLTEPKDSICGQSNESTKDLILNFFEFMQQDVFPFIGKKKKDFCGRGGREMRWGRDLVSSSLKGTDAEKIGTEGKMAFLPSSDTGMIN